ncbi:MAG TPA: amidase family protein, partial [Polyangiales bacterium]|nr:amidase family protein [Polyangiales bacterium]
MWFQDAAFPIDASVANELYASVDALRHAGVQVDEVHPEVDLPAVHRLYRQLLEPILALGAPPALVARLEAAAARPEDGDHEASFARNALIRHADWLVAHEFRVQLKAVLARFFRDYDVLLCPVTPVAAFPHDHREPQSARSLRVNGAPRSYMDLMGWACLATAAWHPATSMPVGRTPEGLPVGLQVIGPYLEDLTPIDFAGRLSELVGGFERPPGF